jgi:MFS family permease
MKLRDRNILLYLFISIIGSMDLTRGIFTLFLASRGLSPIEIGVLQSTLFWTSLVCDVPTGIFADRHRRRTSLALGFFLVGVSSLLMPFSLHFVQFACLFALQGVGFAFRSGAGCAWLFDRIEPHMPEAESLYLRISALWRTLSNFALAFAVAVGPWLRGSDWSLCYIAFGGLMLLASILCFALSEPSRRLASDSREVNSLPQMLKEFCSTSEGHRLLSFIGIMAFLEASHTPLFIFMQLKLKGIYSDERWIGFAVAAVLVFSSLSLRFVPLLEQISLRRKMLVTLCSVSIATFALAYVQSPWQAIPLFCFSNAIPSLLFVFTDKAIQDQIPSHIRASFLSVHSAISSVAISFSYLGIGAVMGHSGISAGIVLLAFLPLAGAVALNLACRRNPAHVFA